MKSTMKIASVFLGLSLVGCSGSGGSGSSGTSGVDQTKNLADVTEAEAEEVCEWVEDVFNSNSFVELDCWFEALLSSQNEAGCLTIYDDCLAESEPEEFDCETDSSPDDLPACADQVTIGEYESCFAAQEKEVGDLVSGLSCTSDPEELRAADSLPAACQTVADKCPELIGAEEVDEGSTDAPSS